MLQRAVAMVLEAVYEQDFLDCSYGFRPGRSAHQALGSCGKAHGDGGRLGAGGGHPEFLRHSGSPSAAELSGPEGARRSDAPRLDKWLKAGVLEGRDPQSSDHGTPQGGVISPLLANIYLHEVLDKWFEQEVKPRLQGAAFLIRYADDFVMVFQGERCTPGAGRAAEAIRQVRPDAPPGQDPAGAFRTAQPQGGAGRTQPHESRGVSTSWASPTYWGKSRRGNWVVKRKTASDRFTRFLRQLNVWCQGNRHAPLAWQHAQLLSKLRGHYGYYGITGNSKSLSSVHHWVKRIWRKWLSRRSRTAKLDLGAVQRSS